MRRHESALFWLAEAAVVGGTGGVLVTATTQRLGQKAHLVHHFWFVLGAAFMALGVLGATVALLLYARQRLTERGAVAPRSEAVRAEGGGAPRLVREKEITREYESAPEPRDMQAGPPP
jgi:hypothetical protein